MKKFDFPDDFTWGTATSALQIEGATQEDGRGASQWDVFCQMYPERIFERATPDIACDHYHRYQEDVDIMKELKHNGYRLSISWSRIFPTGAGKPNPAGIAFYQSLFTALNQAGITPNVTLYHWDLPQTLAEKGGWENPATVDHFVQYAKTCFTLFHQQVKLWVTFNEPSWTTLNGYVTALHPPLKHDYRAAVKVAYHFILAHSRAVAAFRALNIPGEIGIVLNMSTIYPATPSPEDKAAAHLADGILNRWFIDPVLLGEFPHDILDFYRRNGLLPLMPSSDIRLIKEGKIDFIGVNYYYPHYASASAQKTQFGINNSGNKAEDCYFSIAGLFQFVKNPHGKYTDWRWEIDPQALYALLQRAQSYRPGIPIYITENGIGLQDILNKDGTVEDDARIEFIKAHLEVVAQAINDGLNVKGYYMWSLMDNFSWINGYKKRYGLLYIDRTTLQRYKKKSAFWLKEVIQNKGF